MRYTQYFVLTRLRADRARIKDEWIEDAVQRPVQKTIQKDGRIRMWTYVAEEQKYLRVVVLPDGETIHNAFFDRSFKE
ncbi:MAG: hypothetical protein EA403_03865 [Spirochaetaceae bacterium]|nr:MAG: hypothetical protein EA403_03865 [Spirochaetaceae bacterium]